MSWRQIRKGGSDRDVIKELLERQQKLEAESGIENNEEYWTSRQDLDTITYSDSYEANDIVEDADTLNLSPPHHVGHPATDPEDGFYVTNEYGHVDHDDHLLRVNFYDGLNAQDITEKRKPGVLNGSPSIVRGPLLYTNFAALFDAINDYVSFGDDSDFDFGTGQDFTVCFWMRTTANGVWIFAKRHNSTAGGWGFRISGNKLTLNYDNSGGTGDELQSVANIDDDAWHFCAAVFVRASGVTLYVDIEAVDTGANPGVDVSNAQPLVIGASSNGAGFFGGYLTECSIFKKALSVDELRAVRARGQLDLPFIPNFCQMEALA